MTEILALQDLACDGLNTLNSIKADNITCINSILQLSANGIPIGDAITIAGEGTGGTGAKGDKGDTGDKGEKGDTGQAGAKGDPGKSAYQSAVDGGYTGTEQEYNAIFASIGSINAALSAILEV